MPLMVKISDPETLKLVLYSRNMMMSTLALFTALMSKGLGDKTDFGDNFFSGS